MPKGVKGFQEGNTYGGYRENAGRPTNEQRQKAITLLEALEAEELRQAEELAQCYYKMAKHDPATMRHVVDGKRIKNPELAPGSTTYQFIQFNNHHHTAQLPAEAVSDTVLVGDGRGQETGGEVLASQKRQGQDGPKFHSFAHVPGKRR